jgi:SAM-dependent methyltransferase
VVALVHHSLPLGLTARRTACSSSHSPQFMADDAPFDYSGTELAALSAAVNYYEWIYSRFERYLGGSIVEVGAGIGTFSKLLLRASPRQLVAFEPSRNLYPLLVESVRHDERVTPINDVFKPHYVPDGVDSIVYLNVLEHIEQDSAELKTAYEALRPGGHLIVFSPALSWLYSEFDKHVGHFRRYSKRGIVAVAKEAGYRVLRAEYFDIAGVIPWYLSFVLLKSWPTIRKVALYDKLVVPPMRVAESVLSPPFGKNVLLVATRT